MSFLSSVFSYDRNVAVKAIAGVLSDIMAESAGRLPPQLSEHMIQVFVRTLSVDAQSGGRLHKSLYRAMQRVENGEFD